MLLKAVSQTLGGKSESAKSACGVVKQVGGEKTETDVKNDIENTRTLMESIQAIASAVKINGRDVIVTPDGIMLEGQASPLVEVSEKMAIVTEDEAMAREKVAITTPSPLPEPYETEEEWVNSLGRSGKVV